MAVSALPFCQVPRFGKPTWKRLVEAVEDCVGGNNPALAQEIARNHPSVLSYKMTPQRERGSKKKRGGKGGWEVGSATIMLNFLCASNHFLIHLHFIPF